MTFSLVAVILLCSGYFLFDSTKKSFPKVALMETCFADNIAGAIKTDLGWVTKTNVPLLFSGWSGDKSKTTVATKAVLQLINSNNDVVQSWETVYGVARPDVASAFDNPALADSGFQLEVEGITIPGAYRLQIGSVNGGTNQLCQNSIPLIVED